MDNDLEKEELLQIIKKLKDENNSLREIIYGKKEDKNDIHINNNISTKEKIKIFMDVFSCRMDIYAKRYTSKNSGKSGYSPVCKNQFSQNKCDIR